MTGAPRGLGRRPRRGWRIALGVLVALAAFVWAFDWNWLRPAIHRYVMAKSGRSFDFDDLKVHLDASLDPTLEFRGLTVQNAPWAASKAPLVQAGHVSATYAWRTLFSSLKVVKLVVLEDAQVDMERHADGLRNWRITQPDDRGPPHAQVLALQARRSSLHVINDGIGLVAAGRVEALPAPRPVPDHPDLPLTQRLVFDGTTRGHPFAVDTAVSDVLTFGLTARRFSLEGTATLGALRLTARGFTNDAVGLGDLDIDARATSDGRGSLWPLPQALGRATPLAAGGHVVKVGESWVASGVRASLGHQSTLSAEIAGVGTPKSAGRRSLRATLRDVVLDSADIAALSDQVAPGASPAASSAGTLSARPLDATRLRAFDADVDLRDARFIHPAHGMPQTLRLHAVLKDGVMDVRGLDAGLADGHVTGALSLDASHSPLAVNLELRARGLDVARLSSALAADGGLVGTLDGNAVLHAQGDSPRTLAAATAGLLNVTLAPGASVSKRLDAKLSLDGGEWLRSLFDKSDRVAVECATVSVDIAHGVATTRSLVFETEHTALAGKASVRLADQSVDATVTPVRKQSALLALDKSIHAAGTPGAIKVSLVPAPEGVAAQRCRSGAAPG